jgi:aspartate oxidase
VYPDLNDKKLSQDIVSAGADHSWMPAVEQISSKGAKLVEDILINKYKIPFERDDKNQLMYTSEAAHSAKKIIHCNKKNLIEMVLDIEKYPDFVPWCLEGKIHEKNVRMYEVLVAASANGK